MSNGRSIAGLIVWLLISFIPAWVGAMFTPGEWYVQLQKPSWTPPGYVFGPVWTLLYAMMGVAAWAIWRKSGIARAIAPLTIFVVQLILNGLWSWVFFGLQNPGLAFVNIVALWLMILATTITFWRHSVRAAVLLLPYLVWVTFASVLNFEIWNLNN